MSVRHLRYWVPLLGVVGAVCVASAAPAVHHTLRTDDTYLIDTWETEDGLPENSATAMAQTPDGYLWFGTFNGLVRFDGVAFAVFDPTNTPQLPSTAIINLHCDKSGRLWVSTSLGLAILEGGHWRALGQDEGWPADYVRTFAERANGDLFISTFHGQVFEIAGGKVVELPSPPGKPGMGYLGCVDAESHWWAVQHQFIGLWDGQRWNPMVPATQKNAELVGCAAARDGGVWVLERRTLRKFRRGVQVSQVELSELPGGLWSLSEDSRGNVWIATYAEGVCRVSPDGQVRRWSTRNGLVSASTRFVFEDRESNLWIGTSGGGLTRFKARRFQSFGVESGLAERVVSSLSPAPDGGLWIATRGRGLFRLRDGVMTNVPLPIPQKIILAQSVLTDRQGRLWLGTSQDLWFDDAHGFRRIHPEQFGGADIRALFEDSHGRIWIGSGKGAAVLDGDRLRIFSSADGVRAADTHAFAEDSRGVIWLSSRDGIFRYENDRFTELFDAGRPIRNVPCLKADTDGAMWLCSLSEGLLLWREDRFARITSLPIRAVRGIVEDEKGAAWLATDRGVVRIMATDLRLAAEGKLSRPAYNLLDQSDGLPSVEFAGGQQPTLARDAKGRLWFATIKGVAMIDPAEFRLNLRPPSVSIEQVVYHAPAATTGGTEVHLTLPASEPVRLPPGSRQIEVRYTAMSFSAPDKVRFQVRLDGRDDDWQTWDDRRVVSFYELAPGAYVFRVRAANDDNVWNETGASLAFTVQPYLWQTNGFLLTAALLLVGGVGGLVWSVSRSRHRRDLAELERTRRQQQELAHLSRVTMLGELSGSMAHELNQPLAAILSNAQAGLRFLAHDEVDLGELRDILKDIADQDKRAGEVIHRLRTLLKKGEVQRQPIAFNDIVREVLRLIDGDLGNHGVTARTDLAPGLPMVLGDRVQFQQVLLNLLMNASDAVSDNPAGDRDLVVRTERVAGGDVCVSVSDRGSGLSQEAMAHLFEPFYTTKAHGLGLGLSVCRRIITAHGGTLRATNNPDRGTTFTFRLPAIDDLSGTSV